MFMRTLLFFLTINCLSKYTCGQKSKNKFFRKDYTYLEATESFYKFSTLPKTWSEAKTQCALEGGKLFYADNDNEAQTVLSFWKANQPHDWIYIGLSDLAVKGVFETVDGYPLSDVYNKWAPGEPNDVGGIEDCVVMHKEGKINDDRCDKKLPFICKKTLRTLEWNKQCNTPYSGYVFNQELGRCYNLHSKPMTWNDANAKCNAEQSYLAVINSRSEVDFLVRIYFVKVPKSHVAGAVHLGFRHRPDEGWQTVRGTALEDTGYACWGRNQPDGGDREQCGSMFYNGLLNDIDCSMKAFFICEHEIENV